MCGHSPPGISRRALLTGAGAAALSGCAVSPPLPRPPLPPDASATASREPSPPATPATPGSASPAGGPTASGMKTMPDRADIVARFGSRTPTQWGLDVPGVVRRTSGPAVALTLDACGGPHGSGVDIELLDFLIAEQVPATLFVNQRWVKANRLTFDRLATRHDLFTLGNHGTRHLPLSVTGRSAYGITGTADAGAVYDEVAGNQAFLTGLLGRPPRFFRAGTAFYDDVAVEIVRALGLIPVGFDVNADAGATLPAARVASETAKARAGSIVLAHMNMPPRSTFEGLARALPALRARGLTFATLDDLPLT